MTRPERCGREFGGADRARALREWRRSGLSARAFGERIGLSAWRLYEWRRRERSESARGVALVRPFVRVESEAEPTSRAESVGSASGAVVVFPGGARIEFPGDSGEMFARTVTGLLRRC